MEELRFVRREDQSLVVATESGDELLLVVDEHVLSELRHLSRRDRDASKVRPREIQKHIRAGKSRAEVAELTGLEEDDIERYEEPVLAERRYILELAHAVPVRTSTTEEEPQEFGAVIGERLHSLGTHDANWSSWRDEEEGWMISLDFTSHDVAHHAIWSFDHRKSVLTPVNSDAVTLSKQGDVGERLIPKLRAVDNGDKSERFEPEAFDEDNGAAEGSGAPADPAARHGDEVLNPADAPDQDAEYARRREIDQRAISTPNADETDLGQTADLLDALRRRRGEREQNQEFPVQGDDGDSDTASVQNEAVDDPSRQSGAQPQLINMSSADDPRGTVPETSIPLDLASVAAPPEGAGASSDAPGDTANDSDDTSSQQSSTAEHPSSDTEGERSRRKRRASIPSWDDILFGTRSEDDPS
ncbi:MAG: septation protein SepH [Leucobacter sp.]